MAESSFSSDPALYAVILAGGHGERFWPLSRKARPKHHLALFSSESLLASTVNRLDGLVHRERILVLTGVDQAEAVRALLPSIPADNILVEPERRDTAAAMALAAGAIARRDSNATSVVLPSDHHITDVAKFQETLKSAISVARGRESIVTIGIEPEFPSSSFGYLELGPEMVSEGGAPAFPVARFYEKPSVEVATGYLARGNFRWNAGMFVWTVGALQKALERTAPELSAFCSQLIAASDLEHFLRERFGSVPKISFDYAVMEKLPDALCVQAQFPWDDLGGWLAAGKYFPQDGSGNAGNVTIQSVDARGNVVFSAMPDQHVSLLGVESLIVVNTGDALLVCARDQAERLREIVAGLPAQLK